MRDKLYHVNDCLLIDTVQFNANYTNLMEA